MQTITIRHDTRAWRMQVWISFFASASLCAIGLAWLPGRDLDRAFMVMGYVFCLSAAFALAKFIRDNATRSVDTPLWRVVVWAGFFVAMALTGWGLEQMDINLPVAPFWRQLAVPDLDLLHPRQDAARCAREPARRGGPDANLGVCLMRAWLTRACELTPGAPHDLTNPIAGPALPRALSLYPRRLAGLDHERDGPILDLRRERPLGAAHRGIGGRAGLHPVGGHDGQRHHRRGDQHRRGLGARARLGWRTRQRAAGRPRLRRRLDSRRHFHRLHRPQHRLGALGRGRGDCLPPNEIGRALLYNERITR